MQRQKGPRGTWWNHARRSATFAHALIRQRKPYAFVYARNLTIRHVRRHPAVYLDSHVDARPAAEPVAFGLVKSLARPGGNLAGLTIGPDAEISGKDLEPLTAVLPQGVGSGCSSTPWLPSMPSGCIPRRRPLGSCG